MLNLPLPFGTLLCGIPAPNFQFFGPAGLSFALPIPNDPSLIGTQVCAQGGGIVGFGPLTIQLTNALDLVFGAF